MSAAHQANVLQHQQDRSETPNVGPSLLEQIDAFPPFLVVLTARDRITGRVLDYEEIARRANVSFRTICRLSGRMTWAGIAADVCSRVMYACGYAPSEWAKQKRYLIQTLSGTERPFRHLSRRKVRRKRVLEMLRALAAAKSQEVNHGYNR